MVSEINNRLTVNLDLVWPEAACLGKVSKKACVYVAVYCKDLGKVGITQVTAMLNL